MRRHLHALPAFFLVFGLLTGCSDDTTAPDQTPPAPEPRSVEFSNPVFDIAALPNGNILVAETVQAGVASGPTTVWEIVTGDGGGMQQVAQFTTPGGITPVNGLAVLGQGRIFAARGGLDLGANAAVLNITSEGAEVVGDIEQYETNNDPDIFAIGDWKDPNCAPASGPFTPGPQSNPFRLTPVSGSPFLVADAAGNTLLRVRLNGSVELAALFTPPTTSGAATASSSDPADWREFPYDGPDGGQDDDTGDGNADPDETEDDDPSEGNCYVQPVPNSVAVGPGGAIYVGELTGVGDLGVSRVWRIEPGARDVVCPSADCEVAFDGFTSIMDLTFGPSADLYVVEYDEGGWLTAVSPATPQGGTVNRCDVVTGSCSVAELGGEELSGLTFPTAITFDNRGVAWLLENNLAAPTVRSLN